MSRKPRGCRYKVVGIMDSGVDIVVLGVDISVLVLNALVLGVDISVLVPMKCLECRYTHLDQLGVRTRRSMAVSGTRGHSGEGGRENAGGLTM